MIFDDSSRTDWRSKQYPESTAQFLQRSAWPMSGLVRQAFNKWTIPFEGDNEFFSRIRSRHEKQYQAASFEMLLFTILARHNFSTTRIPKKTNQKTPDFSLLDANKNPVYLECTLVSSAIETELENRKKESVLQYVEELDYPWYVSANFRQLSDESVSKREFLNFLMQLKDQPNAGRGMHLYQGQGWEIELTLHRKPDEGRLCSRGFHTQPARFIDNFKPLYTALNDKKASRYAIGEAPYVICASIDDMTVHAYELSSALFGPNNIDWINLDWNHHAFFYAGTEPINTSVSAVLFCEGLKEFGLASTRISLWHNPFAANPIAANFLPFDEFNYVREGNMLRRYKTEKDIDLFSLMDIDKEQYFEYLKFEHRKAG